MGRRLIVLAVLCAACAVPIGTPGAGCRTAPPELLDLLAGDPVLTADVPGTEITARHRSNPCDPGEETRGSVTVERTLAAGTGWADVRARHADLLAANGWTVATAEPLCATRPVSGRVVAFELHPTRATLIEAAIRFWPFPRDTAC
ncbi:hypothetical protein [Dactylosporangium sp. NPDC006015]|uniref:hypothetical protein n=1 Tax=Dactylosporangium sp. NPDC006015 TaxID=3154576 RepID=UPI0033A7B447